MAKFANMYLGQLGQLISDVEIAMYKIMHAANVNCVCIEKDDVKYNIKMGPSPETNQVRAVFINGIPVLKTNVHHALAALESLEENYE